MPAFLQTLREDLSCHREGILAQGFWALQIYRFGHFAVNLESRLLRVPLRVVHYGLLKLSEVLFGICLPARAKIGRRFVIEHSGCIVLHGLTEIGDDCVIRQGVTIGTRRVDSPREAPKIGNRVDIGAGAKILGALVIGDDVNIGANAVVLKDIPSGHVAVGVPARIRPKKPRESEPKPHLNVGIYTREPVLTTRSGSTSYVLQVISTLRKLGHKVSLHVTCGVMPNRRPVMRLQYDPRVVDHFHMPGYFRAGRTLVRVNSMESWVLAGLRVVEKASAHWGLSAAQRLLNQFYRRYPNLEWTNGTWNLEPCRLEEKKYIAATLNAGVDAVVANYFYMAPLFDLTGCEDKTKVILMHDLISHRQSEIKAAAFPPEARDVSELEELNLLNAADVVLAIQAREAEYVRKRCGHPQVAVLPHYLPVQRPATSQVRGRCLFVGTNIAVNTSGLANFLIHVWPLILAEEPHATLNVCGGVSSTVNPAIRNVRPKGIVPDLAIEYSEAEVCILPLLVGSGLKIKLVEALSYQRACVSTPVGVQGVEAITGGCVLVGESDEAFARHVVTLLREPEARLTMEVVARDVVAQYFSESAFSATLDAAMSATRLAYSS